MSNRVDAPNPRILSRPTRLGQIGAARDQTHIAETAAFRNDVASGVVNIIASAFAIAGFVVLVIRSSLALSQGSVGAAFIVAVSLYGACVIYRFVLASVAAFAGRHGALRALDEAGTFFLPAGLVMPIAFSVLEGATRWILFGIAWGYAFVGFLLYLAIVGWFRRYAISLGYTFFFVILPVLPQIREALGELSFTWLFSGGALYLVAIMFRGKDDFPYSGALWHVFCLAGAGLQYAGISALVS